jgi:hypothetical protein
MDNLDREVNVRHRSHQVSLRQAICIDRGETEEFDSSKRGITGGGKTLFGHFDALCVQLGRKLYPAASLES